VSGPGLSYIEVFLVTDVLQDSKSPDHPHPLLKRVPKAQDGIGQDELFDRFLDYVKEKNLDL
jgi:hypothetical protein